MFHFLINLPIYISVPIVITVSFLISTSGLKYVSRKYTSEYLKENHEVGGFFFNAFGLLYAVLIAFVVFVTWTEFDNSMRDVEMEANQTYLLYLDAGQFPEPSKTEIRNEIKNYIDLVTKEEWGKLPHGDYDPNAALSITKLFTLYSKVDSNFAASSQFFETSIERLNQLSEYRRLRILAASNHVPTVIWIILIIGAIVSVGFTYFFGMRNVVTHYVFVGTLCSINMLLLFLIYDLDHPFMRNDKITTHAFDIVRQVISGIQ